MASEDRRVGRIGQIDDLEARDVRSHTGRVARYGQVPRLAGQVGVSRKRGVGGVTDVDDLQAGDRAGHVGRQPRSPNGTPCCGEKTPPVAGGVGCGRLPRRDYITTFMGASSPARMAAA